MAPRILSVNVSMARSVAWQGETVRTGIFKTPVAHPVRIGPRGLAGDEQADLRFHGGAHKAVYVYPARHYRYWSAETGHALGHGQFGENLTVEGLDESEVRIGDVFRAGTACLQVSEPRIPCFKLAMRMRAGADFSTRFLASGRTGFYLRVLAPGTVRPGDVLIREAGDPGAPTVLSFLAITHWAGRSADRVRRAMRAPALSDEWRERLDTLLSQCLVSDLGNPAGPIPLRVDSVTAETQDIRSVWLRAGDGARLPRHLPGQFLPVTLTGPDGRPVHRSYSISSEPGRDRLRITVRLEHDASGRPGRGSALVHALQPGDRLIVRAPAGQLHPDPEEETPLLLYGAGIGLTPLVPIALDAARRGRRVALALTARRRADLPLADDLDRLAAMGPNASVRIVETGMPGSLRMGADALALPDGHARAFLCGPPDFVTRIRAGLVAAGLPGHRISGESFASPVERGLAGPETTVRFAELDSPVSNHGETLLETAETAGLCPPAGCRAGSCGVCITRIESGDVTYVEPVAPPPPGCVHVCVAIPRKEVSLGPLGGGVGTGMPDWRESDLEHLFDRDP